MVSKRFFQAGGSLGGQIPSYIDRSADKDLIRYLKDGEFCYVLTARQMGKSSLKVRTMGRLATEGWLTASVDLTAFGTKGFDTEQWYLSFLSEIVDALDLDDLFFDWWEANERLTPVARMSAFWGEILLKQTTQPIAIFIDEVDTLLSLDEAVFSTNDFFAAIRSVYNKRSAHPAFQRLNFSILGVASPKDLMSDHERTPFNIGIPVLLDNFSLQESNTLRKGFAYDSPTSESIIHQIYHWTGGQPYLTQQIAGMFNQSSTDSNEVLGEIDALVNDYFFGPGILEEAHFDHIQSRILSNERYNYKMLNIYRQILETGAYHLSSKSGEILYLKLSGLVKEEQQRLIVNNKIYLRVFDQKWLEKAFGKVRRAFTMDLQRWLSTGHSKDALLTGTILEEAQQWAAGRDDLSREERDFLEASNLYQVEEQKQRELQQVRTRQTRRLRRVLAVTIVAAILALVGGLFGWKQADIAEQRANDLQEAQQKAVQLADDRKKALDDFIEAKQAKDRVEAEEKIITAEGHLRIAKSKKSRIAKEGYLRMAKEVIEEEIKKGNEDPELQISLNKINQLIK